MFGIAIFGTIYQNDLINQLRSMNLSIPADALAQNFELVKSLPEPLRLQVQEAFVNALNKMRIAIIPFAGVGLFASLFIEHFELRKGPTANKNGPAIIENLNTEERSKELEKSGNSCEHVVEKNVADDKKDEMTTS